MTIKKILFLTLTFLTTYMIAGYDYPVVPYSFAVRDVISSSKTNANNQALLTGLTGGTKKVNFAEIYIGGTRLSDISRNLYSTSLLVSGTTAINSSRIFYPASIIGNTGITVLDGADISNFVGVKISGSLVITSGRDFYGTDYYTGGVKVIENNRIFYAKNELHVPGQYATLDAASAIASANPSTIYSIVIDTTVTVPTTSIPSNVIALKFRPEAYFDLTGQLILTGQQIEAEIKTIFNIATGRVTGNVAGTIRNVEVYPEWWGAVGDGYTNDSYKIMDALSTYPKKLRFTKNSYALNYGIELDLSKTSMEGSNTLLWCGDIIDPGYAIKIYSSDIYGNNFRNITNKFSGFCVRGNTETGYHGILIGSDINNPLGGYNNDLIITNCSIDRFDRNIELGNNSWRLNIKDCSISRALNYHIYSPSGLTNHGEQMSIINCFIADGSASKTIINEGTWSFINCSFDNAPIIATGSAYVDITGCHFENPGNYSTYRYLTAGKYAFVNIVGGDLIQNVSAGSVVTQAYFLNETISRTYSGLSITNFSFPNISTTYYNPVASDNVFAYIAGSGKTKAKNVRHYAGVMTGSNYTPIYSSDMNLLFNGDFEKRATNNWTITGSGLVTVTVNATAKYNGSYGLFVSGNTTIKQRIYIKPGDYVVAQAFYYLVSGTGGTYAIKFYDNNGVQDTTVSNGGSLSTSIGSWRHVFAANARVAPKNISYVEVEIICNSASKLYIDDFFLNVVE